MQSIRGDNPPSPSGAVGVDFDEFPPRFREALRAFIEVAVEATSVDLDALLHLVGERTCELLGVRRCSVYLRGDDNVFYGKVAHSPDGNIDQDIKGLVAGVGADLFTKEVIATRAPVLVEDARNDPRTIHKTMRRYQVRDMLAVPLLFADEVIGIVYLDDLTARHEYRAADIEIVQTFAGLAALAIRQASLYDQLNKRASIIEHQKHVLERLAEIHASLTRSVLSGADVQAIIRLVSQLVRKPVLLYPNDFEVTGWAAPEELDLREPPRLPAAALKVSWVRDAILSTSLNRPSVLVPPSPEAGLAQRRLLCQLVIGDEPAGYLEVVEVGQRIGVIDVKVVEHAATVLSLEILSQRRQAAAEGQAREDFLNDLLYGQRESHVLAARAPMFGIDLDLPHAVVRVAHEPDADASVAGPERRALLAEAVSEATGLGFRVSVTLPGADLFLVGPLAQADAAALRVLKEGIEQVFERADKPMQARRAAVSRVCTEAKDYPLVHKDLCETIDLIEMFGWDRGVVMSSELGLLRLVVSSGQRADVVRFATELLGTLIEHDGDGDRQLIDTLRTFIDCGAHIRPTAQKLGVHENTVRYRLSRIREISNIDCDNLFDLLNVRLALQVLDIFHGPISSAPAPAEPTLRSLVG
jgi:sugar diacid utilization regulator/GAF domain-containing protein